MEFAMEAPSSARAFVRSFTETGMTVSVCPYCSHIIAAKDGNSLEIAERSHLCAEMWLQTSEVLNHRD